MLRMKNAFRQFGMRYQRRPGVAGDSSPEEPCQRAYFGKTNFPRFDQREGGSLEPADLSETQPLETSRVLPAKSPDVIVPELDEPNPVALASLKTQQEAALPFSGLLMQALAEMAREAAAKQRAERAAMGQAGEAHGSPAQAEPVRTRSMTPCRRKLQAEPVESSEKRRRCATFDDVESSPEGC